MVWRKKVDPGHLSTRLNIEPPETSWLAVRELTISARPVFKGGGGGTSYSKRAGVLPYFLVCLNVAIWYF